MADTKTKAVNGGTHGVNGVHNSNGTNGAPTEKSAKQSKLWQLLALAKELSKDAETIQDFDKSLADRKAADQELEAKRGEVNTLRELNSKIVREFSEYKSQASAKTDTLFAEFEQKYKRYESNKDAVVAMETEVATLREKLEAAETAEKGSREETEKLRLRVQSADADTKGHAAEIKEMNAECEIHRSQMQAGAVELEACKTKLAEARQCLGDNVLCDMGSEELRKL